MTAGTRFRFIVLFTIVTIALIAAAGCDSRQPDERTADGRIRIHYWEVWTDFEGKAMQDVIDEFNKSQDKIFVDMLTVSEIERKLMMAICGGNPPDISGLSN